MGTEIANAEYFQTDIYVLCFEVLWVLNPVLLQRYLLCLKNLISDNWSLSFKLVKLLERLFSSGLPRRSIFFYWHAKYHVSGDHSEVQHIKKLGKITSNDYHWKLVWELSLGMSLNHVYKSCIFSISKLITIKGLLENILRILPKWL